MESYQATLHLQSAFATPLKGDTLFGQLCWAIRNRLGEETLRQCLQGYTARQPFVVVSDVLPAGYWPLPKLPGFLYDEIPGQDRKTIKQRQWLPQAALQQPVSQWLAHARTAAQLTSGKGKLSQKHPQPHNSIHRGTNTTGDKGFAPYSVEQEWFASGLAWTVYLLLDETRLSADDCRQCLTDIGQIGFGRDASIGLGKFAVADFSASPLPSQPNANACLTLAPSTPQHQGYDGQHSCYQLFTRFGRHGDIAVHQEGKPFKNPVLMAQTGAMLVTPPPANGFLGQGLGGNGQLSNTLPQTVHQGYAPVLAIHYPA